MTLDRVRRLRAAAHGLAGVSRRDPAAVVAGLGAVQSQDYLGACWALALRSPGLTRADVTSAFDAGRLLRTHVLRPTWHFVVPADIRPLLQLTGPRIHAASRQPRRNLGLDDDVDRRSRRVLERALAKGPRTRDELAAALRAAGIEASGVRLAFILMRAELDAVICSGPIRDRAFTYMLLDQRVPENPRFDREAALVDLAARYFVSHGPATIRDFTWWSGLTARDCRQALGALDGFIVRTEVDGREYWHDPSREPARRAASVWLLPNYDEFVVAYRDRAPVAADDGADGVMRSATGLTHPLVLDGRVAGSWARRTTARGASIEVAAPALDGTARRLLDRQVARFAAFLGLADVGVSLTPARRRAAPGGH
jgi:hypothetical protein